MKNFFFVFIILILFSGCSLFEIESFYETFINPDLDIKIDDYEKSSTPDLESVPGSL